MSYAAVEMFTHQGFEAHLIFLTSIAVTVERFPNLVIEQVSHTSKKILLGNA